MLIRDIEKEKILLIRSFDSFLRLLHEDLDTPWVNAMQIAEISKEIETNAKRVEKMEYLLLNSDLYFQLIAAPSWTLEKFFGLISRRYADIVSRFLYSQKLWLSRKTSTITRGIEVFLKSHAEELKALESKIQSQAHSEEDISNQWALQLQKARLEAHIENLEKMRVRG